jgi:hypothetical protein
MKLVKVALACFLIILTINSISTVRVAKANPYEGSDKTVWIIESPKNHTIYTDDVLNFSFKCTTNDLWNEYDDGLDLEYCIDGSDYWEEYEDGKYMHVMPPDDERIDIKATLISNPDDSRKTFQYSSLLPSLSDGEHKVTIYFGFKSWGPDLPQFTSTRYAGIIFYIDTLAPQIENLSVNGTGTVDRLLNFTVDEATSWVGYSLDNQANVTITGDAVLRDLSYGVHNVTVYANDTMGHIGASEALTFTVDEPEVVQPDAVDGADLFPIFAIVSIATVAALSIGLLVYFKKIKSK